MTDTERAEAAHIIGWLQGFAHSVWLAAYARGKDGEALLSDEACVEYEKQVERLWSLVMGEES